MHLTIGALAECDVPILPKNVKSMRRDRRKPRVSPVAAGALAALVAPPALAQVFPRFDQVPYVSTQTPATFQALFAGAHTGTVRAIMLGDSQETSPGGQGIRYMPRLNFEFYRHYGNAPETVLANAWGITGGLPPADWLVRLSSAAPGPAPGRVPAAALPPNFSDAVCSTTSGNNVNNNEIYGCLIMLQHDAADTDPAAGLNTGAEYFKRGAGVYLDVYAATNPSSGEIVCRLTPASTHVPTFYSPTLSTQTSTLGLEDPMAAFKRCRFGPLSFAGQPYMQVELSGSDPAKLTDLVAVQFVGTVDPSGWSISSMAAGGYSSYSVQANHPGWTDLIRACSPTVAFIGFGANDAFNARTPRQFHDDLAALIDRLRSALGSGFPVIILGDPRQATQPANAENFDCFPGAAHALATELPNVCAVNSRRLTEEHAWDANHLTVFTSDGVHYTPLGALLKARLEARALFDAFDPGCLAPALDQPPFDASTCAGASVAFTVDVDADPEPTYQWRRAGLPLADTPGRIAGATSATLRLSSLAPADAGSYDCVIANACGTITSPPAALTLGPCCPADLDDGSMSGTPDGGVDISDLLYFLVQYEAGSVAADLDDGSMTGTPDGGVDINDLLYFVAHYEAGC